MDTDRWHEIPSSETMDFITHCIAGRMNFMFSSTYLALKVKQGWQRSGNVDAKQAVGLLQLRIAKPRKA